MSVTLKTSEHQAFTSVMGGAAVIPGFELEGDWGKLENFIKYLGKGNQGIKRDLAKGQRDFMNYYKAALIRGLLTEGSSSGGRFAPHSPNYDSPGTIGIRNGNYIAALRNLKITSSGYVVRMGFNSGDLRRKSVRNGLTLSRYAVMFETGSMSGEQPPRPLWGQTYSYIGGKNRLMKLIKGGIGKRMKQMGIS